ncbi:ABC transporter substrate-binding protein [Dehalococcoidia bacterium]|nr:ABC transporter substrate-binding protein [Dehalococcoidia bacterium]
MRIGRAITFLVLLVVLSTMVVACPADPIDPVDPVAPVERIPIGAIQDTTGATSDVGKDEALGIREAVAWLNDQGGIGGRPIELHQFDYGYRVPEALTLYARFRDVDDAVFIKGWGTPDTEALTPTVNKDRIPFNSGSASGHLTDPAVTPFNFIYSIADYSTQARGLLQFWYDEFWMKHPMYQADREAGIRPRLVTAGHVGHPYPTAPLAALRDQAELLGFEQMSTDPDVHCVHVSLFALDAKSQVMAIEARGNPHVVWFGNTAMSAATLARELFVAGLLYPKGSTMFMGNNYAVDENFVRIAGLEVAEGALSSPFTAFLWDDFPWRDKVHEYAAKINPGVPIEMRSQKTVQAWAAMYTAATALRRVDAAGKLDLDDVAATRIAVRDALYEGPIDTTGLGWPVPFDVTPTDHRPSGTVIVGQVVDGRPVTIGHVDLKAMYPDLWPEWLGW